MLSLGVLAFTQPWLLLAGLSLPALWLLLRVTPPAPRRISFPPLLLLLGLVSPERTPARTPWWLLALRLTIAALLILALANPVLNPAPRLGGDGPLLLVIDNGWAAAKHWDQRIAVARDLLQQAERENREVVVLETAPDPDDTIEVQRLSARAALEALPGWRPRPWPVDRAAARDALQHAPGLDRASSVWLSDGVALGSEGEAAAEQLGDRLRLLGPLQVHVESAADLPVTVRLGEPGAVPIEAQIAAIPADSARATEVIALGPGGESLARVPVDVGGRRRQRRRRARAAAGPAQSDR